MRRLLLTLASAAAGLAACSSAAQKTGLRVDVDPKTFGDAAVILTVAIRATGGFVMRDPVNLENGRILVTTEDTNADGELELVVKFSGPFLGQFSFRVDTDNAVALSMHADAQAYTEEDLIAAASADAELPVGGEASMTLTLATASSPIGVKTRTTDLVADPIDLTVLGHAAMSHLTALAVCNINGDEFQDVVIGAPDDDDERMAGAPGAVYVIWGGKQAGTTITLAGLTSPLDEFHFFGAFGTDHLGTTVACADLDGDTMDDLVVGAPDANGGSGRVFAVFGKLSFEQVTTITLTPTGGAPLEWTTPVPGAQLGAALHAADLDGDGKAELLVSAPGAKQVHVFKGAIRPSAPQVRDADAADHVVFTGATVASIGAGNLNAAAGTPDLLDVVLGEPTHKGPNDTGFRRGAIYLFANVDPTAAATRDVATADMAAFGNEDGSFFGRAVLIADTSGLGDDLFIGAPGDVNTGVVYLVKHDDGFFLAPSFDLGDDKRVQIISGYEPAGLFGSSLAAARAGLPTASGVRLAVGAPGVTRNDRPKAGAAYLYKADGGRKFRIYEQVFGGAADDGFGTVVAGGDTNGDQIGDLVTAAPFAFGSDTGSGVVYVRFGR
jgi:hypothetical protein